jgi:prevent-host-death family protein
LKVMDASRARAEFAGVLDRVRERDEPVVIVRYGHPVAALVPLIRLTPRERRVLEGKSPGAGRGASTRRSSRA